MATDPSLAQIATKLEILISSIDAMHVNEAPAVQHVLTDALCHLQRGLDIVSGDIGRPSTQAASNGDQN